MDGISSDRQSFDRADRDAPDEGETADRRDDEASARSASPDPVPAPLDKLPETPTSPQRAAAPQPGLPAAPLPAPVALTTQPPRKGGTKKLVLAAVLLAGIGYGGHTGWHWWTVGRFQETTDNAFLQADKVTVSPRIAGFVTAVAVGDNQPVRAGDVVATIDDRDARIQIEGARAELEKARAQVEGYHAAVVQQAATVASAQADIVNAEAGLAFSTQEAKRYADLLTAGAGTSQRAQQTDADLRQHRATLDKDRAALDAAQKQVHTYEALAASAVAGVASAQAKLDGAELNLGYTTIRAPVDGVVGDRSVRVGQMVGAGTGLLTVVPMGRDIYLVANFKETQLGDMKVGQSVEFTVDAFGDHAFRGTVDSFSPGTGAQFALLPPENATGNFTKVVQRVPVKIRLATDDPMLDRLRPGLSVEATVETRGDARPSHSLVGLAATR
ncbi:HlyD family secretion protein [Lichenibacterium ramalinae]|uniref:HlyD family secretion protein n=1 Tax=Lichenibacterium ramalinae TaxID=2316527 RepID=A0A4Q2R7T0_9HYPH|nr:HlyD family secretion protein [Lichenibacterium ramalinae]RYB01749.1 HlyD family secretion protein [Lichenibacterium ramalinae]